MRYQTEKFINALLFFAKNTDPEKFGHKKLWKLLFLLDLIHFKKYYRTVLEDKYRLRQYGPVPEISYSTFMDTFKEGEKTSLSDVVRIEPTRVYDFVLEKIVPLNDPDLEVFSDSELEIMGQLAKKYYSKRGGEIEREIKKDPIIKKYNKYNIIDFKKFLTNKKKKEYVEYWEEENKVLEEALS